MSNLGRRLIKAANEGGAIVAGLVRKGNRDPEFERQMKVARAVMKKRRNALRELANR